MLGGIGVSLLLWSRLARHDPRLPLVYFSGLCGALMGAKLAYLLAEGWLHWDGEDMWLQWATGKSIVGALLGGYGGVEVGKRIAGYTSPTGDWFALVAPVGILIGRIGCLLHGCCLGRTCAPAGHALPDADGNHRWPAVPAEMAFNAGFLLLLVFLIRHQRRLAGQHFHLYLITYGLFRLAHETVRDTPRIFGPLSGYQLLALGMVCFGGARYRHRAPATRKSHSSPPPMEIPRT
jgi:phosphatidylglycerol---prolipoprotein diacylglyceryl transferase